MHPSLLVASFRRITFYAACAFATALSAIAQTAGAGSIEGRVFNPLTGEYLRNAEVRLQGTEQMAVTESDGRYRFSNVPAGEVTLAVSYTGYLPATASLRVTAGQVATRDFDLQSTTAQKTGNVVELDRFTVSSRREGTAKAIMEQRNSLNVKNIIASDTFGDMMENNIAEVLQYLPGMEIFYCGGDPNTLKMRGMPARYGALTIDGVRTVGTISGNRQPEINAYSANAADTLEYTKTNSADMDADAPAGTVNMKSKSAFQRKGRFFAFQLYALVNSYEFSVGKSNGPNDGQTYKTLPGASLDYSDVYFGGKLGVVVNLSETNSSNEQGFVTFTYNTAPTAASPEPVVLSMINYTNGPKVNRRQSGGLNLEYKLMPGLTAALRGSFNYEDARIYNRQLQLITTNRTNLGAGSNATTMIALPTANNQTRAAIAGATTMRTRQNHTFVPSITYLGRRVTADASYAYLRQGQYARNGRLHGPSHSFMAADLQLFNIGWTARRPGIGETELDFQQTSGPDLYVLQNWIATSNANNLTRAPTEPVSRQELAQANIQFNPEWSVPTFFKAGLKTAMSSYFRTGGSYSWSYVGPNNNRLTAVWPVSVYEFFDAGGGNIFSQKPLQLPDRQKLGSLLEQNPEQFVQNPADRTSAANVFPERSAREYIDSGYIMANARFGRLTVQGGVRREITETKSKVYERNVPRTRTGEYADNFLSGSARYRFSDKLMAIASASQSIGRVDLPTQSGVATINEDTLTGTIPNLELQPEHGKNYSARLEYYFEPVGVVSAGVFMMDTKNLQFSTNVASEEIGLGDEYPGYRFNTMDNAGSFRAKGFELEYSQQLTFLPGVFRGLGAFANYSRTQNSDVSKAQGQSPKTASGGISFRYRRLNTAIRASWTADTIASATTLNEERTMLGLSASYQLSQHLSLFFTGRNVLNAPITVWRTDLPGYLQANRVFGSNWTLGVKGTY